MNSSDIKTPIHLWIIGTIAVLWNAMGAFDYSATKLQLEFYMSQFSQEQLDYFYSFPVWAVATWAIAVWSALLASILLLLRKALAAPVFGLALLSATITFFYSLVLSSGLEMMGVTNLAVTLVVWFFTLFLWLYARAMIQREVLA